MQHTIEIGDIYGRFTVIGDAPKDRFGNRCFRCRCECGYEADYPVSVIVHKTDRYCRKCVPHSGGYPEPDYSGQTINGWEVLEKVERVNGLTSFRCRCVRCGAETIRSAGAIRASRSERCINCPPDYRIDFVEDYAIMTLPDGDQFLVDAEDVPRVENITWRSDKENYIVAANSVRLHRLIMGVTDPKIMVDHINRNRKDCRKSNLRVITPFGNSCNHGLYETNKTGYTGVYFSRCSGRYEVKVGYNHRRILLGSAKDKEQIVTLAQMYNIGASFFFGEFAGELNDVPPPTDELVQQVIAKCQKYIIAPNMAAA